LSIVTRSDALNLEAISKAVDQHDARCGRPAVEVAMNQFEVDRLGWDTIRGLPIVADDKIGTGRFEVRCDRDKVGPTGTTAVEKTEPVPTGA
jgi:hypothetical protein